MKLRVAGIWMLVISVGVLPQVSWAEPVASSQKPIVTTTPQADDDSKVEFKDFSIYDLFDDMSDDDLESMNRFWIGNSVEKYDAAIAKSPKDAKAYDDRGDFYRFGDQPDKALPDYLQAIKLDPTWMEPHRDMAMLYRQRKDASKALAEYSKAVALDKTGAGVLLSRAGYYKELGREKEMLADYDTALLRAPGETVAYRDRGDYFLQQRQYEKALNDFNVLVTQEPKNPDYLIRQGKALRGLGRTDDAIAAFFKAHEVDPKRPAQYYQLGLTYLKSQSYDMALENFNQVLAGNDENVPAYIGRSQAYFGLSKYAASQKDLDKAIELKKNFEADLQDPKSETHIKSLLNRADNATMAQAYFSRSLVKASHLDMLSKQDKLEPVALDAMEAVELDPKLVDEYLEKTRPMLADVDDKYGAMALLTGVAGMQPKNIKVLLRLAEAQGETFHSKDAIQTYTKILALDPKSIDALRERAHTCANSSQPYKAEAWLPAVADWKQVLVLKPNDIEALMNLCVAQYNAGQNLDGIATSRQLIKLVGNNAYPHILLGLGLAINGDKDGAMMESQNWIEKLNGVELEKAVRAVGNAKTHYPDNAVLPLISALIAEKSDEEDEDDDDDDDTNTDNPYFV